MFFTSTRDNSVRVCSAEAITRGISADGGLFVPVEIPQVSLKEIEALASLDYIGRAKSILSLYLTDFSESEIDSCVRGAYSENKFSDKAIAPLQALRSGVDILELWKGPTCAFKDMALQLLPRLLTVSVKKTAADKKIVILVATSGDTGKAALEGFKDVENTSILVFYPDEGVSPVQQLQMTTQEGSNVSVCAVRGNFDDTQNGVKAIFTDEKIAASLAEKNMMFSSANSINWGRLVPQIVYYFSAYCDLLCKKSIACGDKINIVVPTGNFGNILAAYYAREMGLPVSRLICASNANCVLTEFISTGVYNRKREFFTTISPSMDILISSNLERLLFAMSGGNSETVKNWMADLKNNGSYNVGSEIKEKISALFSAGFCDDEQTKKTIAATYGTYSYLCDTHTAVGINVFERYVEKSGDKTPCVIVSTASPFKFGKSVLSAISSENFDELGEFEILQKLSEITGEKCPGQLANLENKPVRFSKVCSRDKMEKAVFDFL